MIPQIASTFHGQNVEKILKDGNSVRISPQGFSMWPTILPGRDKVEIQPIDGQDIRRGDIVLYRRPSSILVLHRVMEVRDGSVWLCGDNQFDTEGPLPTTCILGVMTARIRNGKRIETPSLRWHTWSAIWYAAMPARRIVRMLRSKARRNQRKH
jgi:hypothetical protein